MTSKANGYPVIEVTAPPYLVPIPGLWRGAAFGGGSTAFALCEVPR